MNKSVDYEQIENCVGLVVKAMDIVEKNTEWSERYELYCEILETIHEINYEMFGCFFLNICNVENLICDSRMLIDINKDRQAKKAISEWAKCVRKTCIYRQIRICDNRIFLDFIDEKEDYYYIVCPAGLGDTFYVASFCREFKKNKRVKKICLIVKENHVEIPSWFEGVDAFVASNVAVDALEELSLTEKIWSLDNYLYGHFRKRTSKAEYPDVYLDAMNRIKNSLLGIPVNSSREYPFFNNDNKEKLIKKYCLDKNTIIFSPYAGSTSTLPSEFWDIIANCLHEKGYKLYTNVVNDTQRVLPFSESISESINDTVIAAQECLAVIAIRSGLCDLIASTDTILISIDVSQYFFTYWNLRNIYDKELLECFFYSGKDSFNEIYQYIEKIF